MFKLRKLIPTLVCLLIASAPAGAMREFSLGNKPVRDQNWRQGASDVANLKCRVGWSSGPSFAMSTFLYRGETDAFNEALKLLAKVRAPSVELIVCDGPAEESFLKTDKDPKSDTHYDWEFATWNVQSYYHLYGNPQNLLMSDGPNFRQPLPPPRMTVFIGGGGLVVWDKVQVPKGIHVIDRRATAAGIKQGSGAVVTGNVFNLPTSKPLPDAKIEIQQYTPDGRYAVLATGKADEDGRFRIEKVPSGGRRVVASAPGFAPLVAFYGNLVADGFLALDDVELAPEAKVSGTVLDDAGKPIAGATVLLDNTMGMNGMAYSLPQTAETTTDAQGRFEITGVPTGYGRLVCFAKEHHAPLGEVRQVPASDVLIRMRLTGTVKGKVLGSDGKPPAGQVMVDCNPEGQRIGKWGGSMQPKADGTFEFKNVPPGKYTITARPNPGRTEQQVQQVITVTEGKAVEVELKLR